MALVRHPILVVEVENADGTRSAAYRVYCRLQRSSVDVGTCCACPRCDTIADTPAPAVLCALPDSDPRTEIASLLEHGTTAIAPDATLAAALSLLNSLDQRLIAVVAEDRVVGILHELTAHGPRFATVESAMSSPLVLPSHLSPREALRVLASAHLREAVVIDAAGTPLGVFRDVDGLHAVALERG